MSGILERIARRRRESASRRLGPSAQNGQFTFERNGAVPVVEEPEELEPVVSEPVAPPEPESEPATFVAAPERAPEPEIAALEPQRLAPEPPAPEPWVHEPERREPEPRAPEPEAPELAAEPLPESPAAEPTGFRERARIRRRARYLRQLRELQLRDIGGLLLESRLRERERPDLADAKITAALDTDRELRALERALGDWHARRELRAVGIGGACRHCGAIFGSADKFCSACGRQV